MSQTQGDHTVLRDTLTQEEKCRIMPALWLKLYSEKDNSLLYMEKQKSG